MNDIPQSVAFCRTDSRWHRYGDHPTPLLYPAQKFTYYSFYPAWLPYHEWDYSKEVWSNTSLLSPVNDILMTVESTGQLTRIFLPAGTFWVTS